MYALALLLLASSLQNVFGVESDVDIKPDIIKEFRVGVLIIANSSTPYDHSRAGAAIDLAFEKVNQDVLNGSYKIVKVERQFGPHCDANQGPGLAAELYYDEKVSAIVGPSCTYALDPVARLAAFWNIPILTGLGDSGRFKNKTDFKTLTRLAYCQCRLRKVFGSVFKQFQWTDITLIMDRDDQHGLILGETLDAGLRKGNYFPHVIKYYNSEKPKLTDILKEAAEKSRVIVLCVKGETVRQFMLTAYDLGYVMSGEFVFMDVELFHFPGPYWGDFRWKQGDENDEKALKAYDAVIRIALFEPHGPEYEEFNRKVKERSLRDYGYDYGEEKVNFFVGAEYDAVYLYGKALNQSLSLGQVDALDGYTLSRTYMWDYRFLGITDWIFIDDNGDRDTSYAILDLDMDTGEFKPVANYWGNKPGYTALPDRPIHWPGGKQGPPPNEPFCWFKGNNPACKEPEPLSPVIIALVAVLCSVILVGIIGFLSYRRYKLEAELRDMSWIIQSAEVTKIRTQGMTSMISMRSSVISGGDNSSLGKSSQSGQKAQMFTEVGTFQGQTVALRHITDLKMASVSRSLMFEVKARRALQHANVTRFVGAILDGDNPTILHEYCPKGSLQDVLANDSLTLDAVFKMSLIEDIVSGLYYIHHSDVGHHGRLRSSNCVIDSRFVLKLTDFGLETFISSQDKSSSEYTSYQNQLYSAPEQLRSVAPEIGSVKADIYSFAIILEEISVRGGPYEMASVALSAKDIVDKVCAGENPPFRPEIPEDACTKDLRELIHKCWAEDPGSRPDTGTIKSTLKHMRHGKEVNIMDNLLSRMEQYATNLEGIVADRTAMLVVEQQRTEQLLLQILPRSIADQLKHGHAVDPETYACVTIYFSDIVGFTAISAASTPLEVVQMLNDLYTCFDSTIENFDVYKVETIGDAYMVVSGLPELNGNTHAREIARMSLALLAAIDNFKMRHKPDEKMKLRIGLHSGPCVAGVVGLKMPRYCLFGDTVNTASRMESTGEALKIHISQTTKDILDEFGTFELSLRGEISVKGKQVMTTYWVHGEKGCPPKE